MFSLENLLARPVSFKKPDICYKKPALPEPHKQAKHIIRKPNCITTELLRVNQLVQGFNANKSNAWIYLKSNYGDKITHNELIHIAKIVSVYTGIRVSRDAKRRKVVLLKWFDENWHAIKPVLAMVSL